MGRGLDRFIDGVELMAGVFLAIVAVIVFIEVLLRYFFVWSIPDSYDISALLLGILIFWGMAAAGYRGDHITVDFLWAACPAGLQWLMELFAQLVTLAGMAVFTWMMGTKVLSTRADNILTYELHLPVWIFYGVAWAGLVAAVLLLMVRVARLVLRPGRRLEDHWTSRTGE